MCGKALKQQMHFGEQMELRNSNSHVPLPDNNPTLPERKGAAFAFCFSTSCTIEMKEVCLLGRQGRQTHSMRKKLLSLRAYRACSPSLLCPSIANESNLVWKWSLHMASMVLPLEGGWSVLCCISKLTCDFVCFRPLKTLVQ